MKRALLSISILLLASGSYTIGVYKDTDNIIALILSYICMLVGSTIITIVSDVNKKG